MTLPIERARSRKPVTWLTIVGVILLPVLIGGVLVAALYNPAERLDNMRAAIVNDDQPVEIDGQLAPLGRQLTAGLVAGSDDVPSNLDWVISNDEDASAGLADGTYDAVITIPTGFSAAATSTAPGGTPEKATIRVDTAPDSLVVDDAITAQITQAATSLMGSQLSAVYLENVFLGFTTLGDQLGDAADGARQLADGGRQAADGATALADGAGALASGAGTLAGGASELAGGASEVAGGATDLAGGASQLADGADAAATGLTQWSAGARVIAENGRTIAGGLGAIADGFTASPIPEVPQSVVDAAKAVEADQASINASLTQAAGTLQTLAQQCAASPVPEEWCADVAAASSAVDANLASVQGIVANAGAIATGLQALPALGSGIAELSSGLDELSGGIDQLAAGADAAAGGVAQLSTGADQLAGGAGQLAGGADQLADGAGQLADGASQLSSGAGELSSGAGDLASGVGTVADGTVSLADGLDTATAALPSYTDQQATDLASVVAAPVEAEGLGSDLFGASAIPLLTGLALWLGAIGSFIALQALPRGALSSRRPSVVLTLRAFAPAAVIGLVQGVLVAVVVQLAASYDPWTWAAFAGLAALAGVAFAAINQALVALLGGAGRWVAAGVAVLAVATGVVSTVPGVLSQIASLLPTASAYQGLLAVLTSAGGGGAAVAGLVIWLVLSLVVTVIVTARARTTSVRAVLHPAGA
ncbi:YhgE/Pip domain-containing protein [Microbacterium oleivorans]|uniref:ABC transporter permease n=1 Tax=Microbacterium oleivorans TaxID=273677 RepID=A0A7D5EVB3_9MICO|nr:YhgE/Pip family protein [Microbacterium oleivorans]QLD11251.1 ABC transporter permease [Microbacterium oleivorans]